MLSKNFVLKRWNIVEENKNFQPQNTLVPHTAKPQLHIPHFQLSAKTSAAYKIINPSTLSLLEFLLTELQRVIK